MSAKFSEDWIAKEVNQCVSCGLCLPHCPTYRLLQSEADSPRGRIALMGGVVHRRIPLNARFIEHMDRCLTCRACEAVCPNQVAYGNLIDQTRAMIADSVGAAGKSRQSTLRSFLIRVFINRPKRLESWRRLFYWGQKYLGLTFTRIAALRYLSRYRMLTFIAQLPEVVFPYWRSDGTRHHMGDHWQSIYPATGEVRGSVGLFLGCVARITDAETLNSSIFVLNRLGYTVYVPPDQVCCGAIHQHDGALMQAEMLARRNQAAFAALDIDVAISTASGCGVQLRESGGASERIAIMDISEFLVTAEGWQNLTIEPLQQEVLVHEPCTLRNVFRSQRYPYQLLARIPGVQAVPLVGNDQCCGAAGTYFIDQPELANRLRDAKLALLSESETQYLVTSNIGCAMHLIAGLAEKTSKIRVMHPVALLARQMGFAIR